MIFDLRALLLLSFLPILLAAFYFLLVIVRTRTFSTAFVATLVYSSLILISSKVPLLDLGGFFSFPSFMLLLPLMWIGLFVISHNTKLGWLTAEPSESIRSRRAFRSLLIGLPIVILGTYLIVAPKISTDLPTSVEEIKSDIKHPPVQKTQEDQVLIKKTQDFFDSIEPPAGWIKRDEAVYAGMSALSFAPDYTDRFSSLTVTVVPLTGSEDSLEKIIEDLRSDGDYTVSTTLISGQTAYALEGTQTFRDLTFYGKSLYVRKDGIEYRIRGGSTLNDWPKYQSAVNDFFSRLSIP